MRRTIVIKGEEQRIEALRIVEGFVPLSPVHEVVIREHKEDRTIKQQRLQWLWNTEIGNYLGTTKDDCHEKMKEKFAVPIFTRDDPDYAEMVQAVKEVRRKGMNREADILKKTIVSLTSTGDFNVIQNCEYLRDMEMFAAEVGAPITFPADIYAGAMGRY